MAEAEVLEPDCLCHVEEKRLRMDPEEFERMFGHLGPCGSVDRANESFARIKQFKTKNQQSKAPTNNALAAHIISTDGAEAVPVCVNHANATRRMMTTLERLFEYGREPNDGEAPGLSRRISYRRQKKQERAIAELTKQHKFELSNEQVTWRKFNPKSTITMSYPVMVNVAEVDHNEKIDIDDPASFTMPPGYSRITPEESPEETPETTPEETPVETTPIVTSDESQGPPKSKGWKRKP
jgi:hypothetical protein